MNIQDRLRHCAKHTGLDAVVELLTEAAAHIEGLNSIPKVQGGEPVPFLLNGTRFKMSFQTDLDADLDPITTLTCFNNFQNQLDGRWVALVAAEDDVHLKLRAAQPGLATQAEVTDEQINDLIAANAVLIRGSFGVVGYDALRQFARAILALRPQAVQPMTDEHHGLDTDERVCFYEQDFYVLSNFSSFRVTFDGQTFDTSEAAYHYQRFASAEDRRAVQYAYSAHDAFRYAQDNKTRQRPDWDTVKVSIMRDILMAKVAQHDYVRRKLLATGDRELVENSWRDNFWGWGAEQNGQNILGKLWMSIRSELRGITAQADLWCIHIPGPDEVHAAPSKEAADHMAAKHNAAMATFYSSGAPNLEFAPSIENVQAVAIKWPYDQQSHADELREFDWSGWGLTKKDDK